MLRFVDVSKLSATDAVDLLVDLVGRVKVAMLCQVTHQLLHHTLVPVVHGSGFESVTFAVEQETAHVGLVVKLLEVESSQVDDVPWVEVRLLVKDVHDMVLQNVVSRDPCLCQLADF